MSPYDSSRTLGMTGLCTLHNVFTMRDERVVVFRVFEDLVSNLFHVQSCDDDLINNEKYHQSKIIELFAEELPNRRIDGFKTIGEAIEAFEQDFE